MIQHMDSAFYGRVHFYSDLWCDIVIRKGVCNMNPFTLNARIIHVFNSCDRGEFVELIDDIVKEKNVMRLFTSVIYVWNIIRPRDFYKLLAGWVVDEIVKYGKLENADVMIKVVLKTAKTEAIKETFIWNVTKNCPLLTIDTIQYMSAERLANILQSTKYVYCDEYTKPIMDVIKSQHDQILAYQALSE